MENLDVIVLTALVVIAFIIFIISSFKELSRMVDEPYKYEKASGFTRAALFNALSSLFEDDEDIPKEKKEKFRNTLERTISDMETNGIYFDEIPKPNVKRKTDDDSSEGQSV